MEPVPQSDPRRWKGQHNEGKKGRGRERSEKPVPACWGVRRNPTKRTSLFLFQMSSQIALLCLFKISLNSSLPFWPKNTSITTMFAWLLPQLCSSNIKTLLPKLKGEMVSIGRVIRKATHAFPQFRVLKLTPLLNA